MCFRVRAPQRPRHGSEPGGCYTCMTVSWRCGGARVCLCVCAHASMYVRMLQKKRSWKCWRCRGVFLFWHRGALLRRCGSQAKWRICLRTRWCMRAPTHSRQLRHTLTCNICISGLRQVVSRSAFYLYRFKLAELWKCRKCPLGCAH